jgi:hypothetical protein
LKNSKILQYQSTLLFRINKMIMIRLVITQKIQVIEKKEIENLFKRISKLYDQLSKYLFV